MIVVDCNILAWLVLPFGRQSLGRQLLVKDREWASVPLWQSELRNVALGLVRRGLLDVESALLAMTSAQATVQNRVFTPDSRLVIDLAQRGNLTAYDAEYIALARTLAVPLVTEDRAILSAFPDIACTTAVYLETST
jgi:predicted nucleic acid-binding protein